MSGPLCIELPGAVQHDTSRGDHCEPIHLDDPDGQGQLDIFAQAMDRFDAQVLAYCQLGNHFQRVLPAPKANVWRLMRHFNGVCAQAFNRRHGRVGHLFEGRFKAIQVDRDSCLPGLCRHVERKPVGAGLAVWPTRRSCGRCRNRPLRGVCRPMALPGPSG